MSITKFPLSMTLFIFVTIFSTSCVGASQMFPTVTPTPGLTVEPTSTASPQPTSTPTSTATLAPTATDTPVPSELLRPIATARLPIRMGTLKTVEEAGFSFKPIIGYEERYLQGQVTLISGDGDTVLSFIGGRTAETDDLESVLVSFVNILSDSNVDLDVGTTYAVMIDSVSGLAAEVNGLWGENPIAGRIVVVTPSDGIAFYGLAFSSRDTSGKGWEPQGRQAFEAVLRTIHFLNVIESQ